MNINRNLRIAMKNNENLRKSMKMYGTLRRSTEIQSSLLNQRESKKNHDNRGKGMNQSKSTPSKKMNRLPTHFVFFVF